MNSNANIHIHITMTMAANTISLCLHANVKKICWYLAINKKLKRIVLLGLDISVDKF